MQSWFVLKERARIAIKYVYWCQARVARLACFWVFARVCTCGEGRALPHMHWHRTAADREDRGRQRDREGQRKRWRNCMRACWAERATDGCRCRGRCHQSICGPAVGRGEQAGSVMGPAETAARHRDSPRAARSARALESSPARKGGNGGRRDGVQEERAASRRQERTAMSPARPCPLPLRLRLPAPLCLRLPPCLPLSHMAEAAAGGGGTRRRA